MIGLGLSLSLGTGGPGTPPGPPAAPSAFTVGRWALAGNAVSGQLAVTINSLPPSNGSTITDVEYRVDGGSWVSSSGIVSFVIGSLTNGTEYDVELRAVNAIGNGDAGDLKSATPATYAAAPSVTLTAGDGQVSIAWTDGATNGSAITSHKLYWSTSSGVTTADYAGDIMTGSPYVLSGLTNDVPVYVKLAAVNGVGTGALSTEKSATPSLATVSPIIAFDIDTQIYSVTNLVDLPAETTGGQWYYGPDDGTPLTGETDPTELTVANAIAGGARGNSIFFVWNDDTANPSNRLFLVEQPALIDSFDFTSNDGTYLSGRFTTPSGVFTGQTPYFTLSSGGTYAFQVQGYSDIPNTAGTYYDPFQCVSGGLQRTITGDYQSCAYFKGGSDDTFEFEVTVPTAGLGVNEWCAISMIGVGDPAASYTPSIDFIFAVSPTLYIIRRLGYGDGAQYDHTHGLTGDITVRIRGNKVTEKIRVWLNDVELPEYDEYVPNEGMPINSATGTPMSMTGTLSGFRYRFETAGKTVPEDKAIAKSVAFYTPVAYSVAFSNITVFEGVYTFDIDGPVGMTSGETALFDADWNQVTAFATFSCTAGVATGVTITDLDGDSGAKHIVVRNAANRAQYGVADVTMTPFQNAELIVAMNMADILGDYATTNLFHMAQPPYEPAAPEGTLLVAAGPWTADGKPTTMPAGPDGIRWAFDFAWPDDPASPVYGTYDVLHSPEIEFSAGGDSYVSYTNVLPGVSTFTVAHGVENPFIFWKGGLPADPADLYFNMFKQGLTTDQKTRFYRPAIHTQIEPYGAYRSLFTMRGWPGNGRKLITSVLHDNGMNQRSIQTCTMPVTAMSDLVHDTGTSKALMMNTPPNWTPAVVREWYTALIATTTCDIYVADKNEKWNFGGSFTPLMVNRGTTNFTSGNRAINEGDWLKGATSGYMQYVSVQRINTGTVGAGNAAGYIIGIDTESYGSPTFDGFTTGEQIDVVDEGGTVLHANVATVATPSALTVNSARHDVFLFETLLALPGATGRIKPVVEWHVDAPDSDWEEILNVDGLLDLVVENGGRLHDGSYVPNWLAYYDDETYMTKAQKVSVATDAAAWKTLVLAANTVAIDDMVARRKLREKWLGGLLNNNGYHRNAMPFGAYEISANGWYIPTFPSVKFNTGAGATPVVNNWYKGRTSGLLFQITAVPGSPPIYDLTGGAWGSNAVGNFRAITYSGDVRYPTSGETFDRVDTDGTTVLESASFVAADASNVNWLAVNTYADLQKSAAWGANYVYYMDKLQSGMICWFVLGSRPQVSPGGEGIDLIGLWRGYGCWNLGGPDELTVEPQASIIDYLTP